MLKSIQIAEVGGVVGRERRARGEQRVQKPKDKRRKSGNMSTELHRRDMGKTVCMERALQNFSSLILLRHRKYGIPQLLTY